LLSKESDRDRRIAAEAKVSGVESGIGASAIAIASLNDCLCHSVNYVELERSPVQATQCVKRYGKILGVL
jgi:hypothetical protein